MRSTHAYCTVNKYVNQTTLFQYFSEQLGAKHHRATRLDSHQRALFDRFFFTPLTTSIYLENLSAFLLPVDYWA